MLGALVRIPSLQVDERELLGSLVRMPVLRVELLDALVRIPYLQAEQWELLDALARIPHLAPTDAFEVAPSSTRIQQLSLALEASEKKVSEQATLEGMIRRIDFVLKAFDNRKEAEVVAFEDSSTKQQ